MGAKEEAKKLMDNMGGMDELSNRLNATYKNITKDILPLIEKNKAQQERLNKPKAKKDVEINGKTCSVSLIVDGRVLINFATIEESEFFYENFTNITKVKRNWFKKLIDNARLHR
jgi:hypothetical protein